MKAIWFLRFWLKEIIEDLRLGIRTCGRDDSCSDPDKHPYEPTPYRVLEKLAGTGYIGEGNTLIDYGCGKGRAAFFFSLRTGCRTIGIECEESFLSAAMKNQKSFTMKNQKSAEEPERRLFLEERAENYPIPPQADRLFFFNPFSVELLRQVMQRVRASHEEAPREILLFFYYPSKSYSQYLHTVKELTFIEDVDCKAFFYEEDEREKIAIFRFH